MIPLLRNVVENKKIVSTNQDPKIIQERWHTRFRPLLTNDCSGRRVYEADGSRSRNASHDLSHERIPRAIPSNRSPRKKKKKLLEKGSKLRSLYRYPHVP